MNDTIKVTLLVLVMAGVIAASVLLFIKPNIEEKQALDGEIAQLSTRLADLQSKEADRAIYEAGIVRNKKEFDEFLAMFPEDIVQANYVDFFGKLEDNKDIEAGGEKFTMSDLAFSENEEFYALGSGQVAAGAGGAAAAGTTTEAAAATTAAGATTEAAAATTAAGATTEAGAAAGGAAAPAVEADSDAMVGIKTNMSISYSGTYKGIKNLLAYVSTNEDRMTIDSMDVTYNEDDEQLAGSFSFNMYAITSSDRVLDQPDVKGVDVGVDNIFNSKDKKKSDVNKSISKNMENGKSILKDYDYYVALNPSSSNADAITIGAKGDNSTVLSSNENSVQNATVKFFMVGAKYYVSYNIGDSTYPEDMEQGVEFDPGEDLNLAIMSSKRKNSRDKSGVKLVIRNDTDMQLNVCVDGDDASDPRVSIVNRAGNVKVYE